MLCLCIVTAIAVPHPYPASAQELPPASTSTTSQAPTDESGLTISPAIVDNTVNAGISFTVPITLGNITPTAVPIEVTKSKLETDQVPNAANENKYDISSWLTIDQPAFLLPSQDRKTINVTVNVPQNAEPGGHYATVFFGALAPGGGEGSGETVLNARVGVVFLITVRGELHAGATLDGNIKTKALQTDAGVTNFDFALQNTGNVHFEPAGNLVIKDLFGHKVKQLPLPIGIVLPGAEKKYSLAWERGIRPGIYTASVKVDAGIELHAKSKRFVILPLVLVIPVFLLLLVVLSAIWRARRRKKRRSQRAAALEAITASEPGEELELPVTEEEGSEPIQQESAEEEPTGSNVPPDQKEEHA